MVGGVLVLWGFFMCCGGGVVVFICGFFFLSFKKKIKSLGVAYRPGGVWGVERQTNNNNKTPNLHF